MVASPLAVGFSLVLSPLGRLISRRNLASGWGAILFLLVRHVLRAASQWLLLGRATSACFGPLLRFVAFVIAALCKGATKFDE